ncbi:MAG: sulfoxide reductase heme-binding subunit YedZ [Anaerolineales bacterium]|nr:sulfoxide reductase heme-binding subunit YedZ [Anaerolineales bacterium]MCK6582954.1 sulfoxide reductase heme-binding subunit YedZ [Anaerolineales bacterium]
MKIFKLYTPLQIAIHLYAWSALAWIAIELLSGSFSINPIQELEQRTGRHAITLLVMSMLCTPLNTLIKYPELLKRRRTLGLYALMYATIHVLIFVNLDYGLAWSLIARTIFEKPYILVGATAFLMLIPLGITSFDVWKVRLGRNWKRLHQTVYLIGPLAVLHFAWSKKGDIFTLSGDIVRPLIYGLVLAIFLILRIPVVKKYIASLRTRGLSLRFKRNPEPKADAT